MITLRDYQKKLIDEAREKLKTKKRLLIQLDCGGGKTAIATFIAKNTVDKNKRVMFLVHRQELLLQAWRMMEGNNIECGLIAPQYSPKAYCLTQIGMIDTVRNRLNKINIPDVLFIDEAHHACSRTWKKVIDFYTEKKCIIILLSATPRRLDGKPLSDVADDIVCGPSTKELINAGHLCNFKYYAPPCVVDMTGVKKRFGDYAINEQAERIDKPHVFGDALEHYKRLADGKQFIAFNVNVQTSKNFAVQANSMGITCLHVDGDMSANDRMLAIKSYECGDTKMLSCVNLLGEGIDIKPCDGVILLFKTASYVRFKQACGRMSRPTNGKEFGFIFDHMNNVSVHGLPDYPHEWNLDGESKSNKKNQKEDLIKIKQCVKCYYAFPPQQCCPNCGHKVELTPQEIEKIEGELVEIANTQLKVELKKEQGQAKTMDDLIKIEQERGYKKGWARHIWESRSKRRA